MTDLSKRLREMAVQRETVTPDEHGVRILSAILNRNKRLMCEAADALDARDAEVGLLRDALERIAESSDAGRHDGLPEECPALDDIEAWVTAREALEGSPVPTSRWQTMESAPRDGTPILVWRNGHPIVRASVWRVRPKMLPDWQIHIIRDGMDPPFEGFPVLTRLGDAKAPTHWHPLPPPPEDV